MQAQEHEGSSLRHSGSVVVVCRLSCRKACEILVHQPGIEPVSPALEGEFLTTGPPGKSLCHFLRYWNPSPSLKKKILHGTLINDKGGALCVKWGGCLSLPQWLPRNLLTALGLHSVSVLVAQLCPTLCKPMDRSFCPWNSPVKNTGVGCHSLFQGIFLMPGENPGLPHCKQIRYHLSHQGNPRPP